MNQVHDDIPESEPAPRRSPAPDAVEVVTSGAAIEAMSRAEIDKQIATAKAYPRNVRQAMLDVESMVTSSRDIADDCRYALPRDGKTIDGPSARFAEIVAYQYGNCRAGTRVVEVSGDHVVAQGFFFDLEKNFAKSFEVRRSLRKSNGMRVKEDMVNVICGQACAIALRNAVLRSIPEVLWQPAYEKAKKLAIGDAKSLPDARAEALKYCMKFGVNEVRVLETLHRSNIGTAPVERVDDITLDHLSHLKGLFVAIREGDASLDEAFVSETVAVEEREKRARGRELEKSMGAIGAPAPPTAAAPANPGNLGVMIMRAFPAVKTDAQLLVKCGEIMSEIRKANVRYASLASIPDDDVVEMKAYLEGGGAVAASGKDVQPAAPTSAPVKDFKERHADEVFGEGVDPNFGGVMAAILGDEVPPLEEDRVPEPALPDPDENVAAIFDLVKELKKMPPPDGSPAYVIAHPPGSTKEWFTYLPIAKALGAPTGVKIRDAGAQSIDAATCKKIVVALREKLNAARNRR